MRVRAPTWDDLPHVLALVTASDVAAIGESDVSEGVLASEWRELDLERDAWVIELDGRIAAYATFEERGGGRMIADGYIDPELRGRGLGSKLLDVTEAGEALLRTAFAEFWRRGERRVALGVAAYSEAAARLYERAGMRRLYTIVLYQKELRPSS